MGNVKKVKTSPKATEQNSVKLPEITPEETAWVDKLDPGWKPSKELKRLLFLPDRAYKTAVYVHKSKLSKSQKDQIILLFRGEAEQSFNVVFEQALLVAGNTPPDRVAYLNDYESWKERLIKLLEKAANCITRDDLFKDFKSINLLSIDNLTFSEKQELKDKLINKMKWVHLQLSEENVFYEPVYWPKFSQFTIESFNLIRRFSLMHAITMERTEWILQGVKNIGVLPNHIKTAINKKRYVAKQEDLKNEIEKMFSEHFAELSKLIKNQRTSSRGRIKRGRKKDPKIKTRNKEIAKYKACNPRKSWKEVGKHFDVSADIARKACNNPDD